MQLDTSVTRRCTDRASVSVKEITRDGWHFARTDYPYFPYGENAPSQLRRNDARAIPVRSRLCWESAFVWLPQSLYGVASAWRLLDRAMRLKNSVFPQLDVRSLATVEAIQLTPGVFTTARLFSSMFRALTGDIQRKPTR